MLNRVPLRRRLLVLAGIVLWIGFVLYPDPRQLLASLQRLVTPPVDATAVTELAATLPDDPKVIEDYVSHTTPYAYAWQLYGMPWYFPTVKEALADKAGDCQATAVITASIFEAKGLPYSFRYSFDHVWVDYPGKEPRSSIEDPATAFVSGGRSGWLASLPDKIPLNDIVRERLQYHWYPMPTERKAGLLAGVLGLFLLGELLPPGFVTRRTRTASLAEDLGTTTS